MKYIGIIWNPTYIYQNEIKKDIKKIGKNIKSKSLNLDNKNFIEFINELYNYPPDEKWKIDYKIKDLTKYSNKKICIVEFEITDTKKIINKKNKLVVEKAQKLKDMIRGKYNFTEVDGIREELYIENSFHLTDNEDEYEYQKKIIEKYKKFNHVDSEI